MILVVRAGFSLIIYWQVNAVVICRAKVLTFYATKHKFKITLSVKKPNICKRWKPRPGFQQSGSQLANFERCALRSGLAVHLFLLIERQFIWRLGAEVRTGSSLLAGGIPRQNLKLSC